MKKIVFLGVVFIAAALWYFDTSDVSQTTNIKTEKIVNDKVNHELVDSSLPAHEKLPNLSIEQVNAELKESGYVAVPAGDGEVEISVPGPDVLEVSQVKAFTDEEWDLQQDLHLREVNGYDVELSVADKEMIGRWRRR